VKDAPDSPVELRARALRLLARREHSRQELERKLAPRAESSVALRELLSGLDAKNQLSEERFAEERARQLSRKYGAARIRQDLKARGIADEIAERTCSELNDLERAREILQRKYRTPVSTREEKAKRMRFLQSRGFASEIIFKLLSARGDD
jgi:regulatory protein